jgi:hypothetical protein
MDGSSYVFNFQSPNPTANTIVPAISPNNADNAAIIQAAIQQAVNAGTSHVTIPAGTFYVGATLKLPSNFVLAGMGRASTLKLKNGANVDLIENSDQVAGNTGITVRDLVLDGNSANQDALVSGTVNNFRGLYLFYIQDLRLENLEVRNCTGTGIETDGNGQVIGPNFVSNIWVHDNGFHGYMLTHSLRRSSITDVLAEGNGSIGVYFDASEVDAVNIKAFKNGNSSLAVNSRSGINVRHVVAHTLSNLTAEYNYGNGIEVNGIRQFAGSNWRAQQNGQRLSNVYSDLSFGADPLLDARGPSGWGVVSSVIVGKDTQTSEGFSTNCAKYGLYIDPEIVNPITINGILFEGNITADYSIPTANANITLNGVKREARTPTATDDMATKGVSIGERWINPSTGETWVNRDNTASASKWVKIGAATHFGYQTAFWNFPVGMQLAPGAAQGSTAAKGIPVVIYERCTISQLGVRITTAAAGNVQLALYNADQTTLAPTTLVGNTASISTSSAAAVNAVLSQGNQQIEPGVYWLFGQLDSTASGNSVVAQGPNAASPFLGTLMGTPALADLTASGSAGATGISITNTFGSWGDFTGASYTVLSSAAVFAVAFKVATAP